MENLLNDTRKFERINLKNEGILNFAVTHEKRVDNILKRLVVSNSISEETRTSLKPIGTRPVIMYGLWKVHKDIINKCPRFRLILSASNTPSYKLAKFLVPILKSLTSNKYTVKHSFPLKIVEQYSEFTIESGKENKMSFLDVQSIREDKAFTTSVYGKSTFSGVYTYFDSFLPSTYKFGTVYTLACEEMLANFLKLE